MITSVTSASIVLDRGALDRVGRPRLAEHAVAGAREHDLHERAHALLVLAEQDRLAAADAARCAPAPERPGRAAEVAGSEISIVVPWPGVERTRTFPPDWRDRAVHRRQPEPRPLAHRLGGVEGLEDVRQGLRRDPDPGVGDREADEHAVGARLDEQAPAVGHRVARVDRQVDHHLLDLPAVGQHPGQRVIRAQLDRDVLADQPLEHRRQPAHDLRRGRARSGRGSGGARTPAAGASSTVARSAARSISLSSAAPAPSPTRARASWP